ncbi:right-handed parallel beta-helix repeat-containing protein [Mucilaginibacter terrae]|uniref:right-handed parallel beta-helix repeat-containing protein n=1 Tax=Mucilaginibacter terrae TaxID=1955052 RepID=UPI00363A1134
MRILLNNVKLWQLCIVVTLTTGLLSCKKTANDQPDALAESSEKNRITLATATYTADLPTKATIYETRTTTLSTLNVSEATKHINNATQINNAINNMSSQGGGTVVLNAGIYRITGPIRLKSKVRLKGVGIDESIIKRDESWTPDYDNGSDMVGTRGVISDMVISDLTIDGNTPSSSRMSNFFNMYGIRITVDDFPGSKNQRAYVTTIKVVNCGMGVHIKHTNDVILRNCDVEANGTLGNNTTHPSPYFFHNVYLRSIDRAQVYDGNRFINSPSGNGLNITAVTNLTIDANIMTGNNFRGVRIGGASVDVVVKNNTVSNNKDFGIGTATDGGTPTRFSFVDNTISNNQGYGVKIGSNSSYGQVRGNSLSGNTPTNSVSLGNGLSNMDVQ